MTEEELRLEKTIERVFHRVFDDGFPVCKIEGYKLAELEKQVHENENAIRGENGLIVKVNQLTSDVANIKERQKSIEDSVKVSQSDIREVLNMQRQQKESASLWKDKVLPNLITTVITAVITIIVMLVILHIPQLFTIP